MTTIVGNLPSTIRNGDQEDATVVMSLFAFIQAQVNSNACPATTGTAVLKGNGSGGTASAVAGTDFLAAAAGMLFDFAGSVVPSGYLACDGSAVSRTTYASLFTAIGTTWGVGDGSTTFNLPDLRGRMAMGAGAGPSLSARTLGQSIGAEGVVISVANLPAHNHPVNITDSTHNHAVTNGLHAHQINGGAALRALAPGTPGGANFVAASAASTIDFNTTDNAASNVSLAAAATGITATTSNTGSGTAVNMVNPSAVVQKIIKT